MTEHVVPMADQEPTPIRLLVILTSGAMLAVAWEALLLWCLYRTVTWLIL